MTIRVDTDDPTPPYEQIRASLAAEITSGRLPAGHRLPTVRQVAADLHVATGTAARAYRELEQAGLVETGRSLGTVVRPGNVVVPDRVEAATEFVNAVRQFVTLEAALDAVRQAWKTSLDLEESRTGRAPHPGTGSDPRLTARR